MTDDPASAPPDDAPGRSDPSQVAHSVGVVLFDDAGNVLLQLREDRPDIVYPNVWAIPSGSVEPGESTVDAARRELLEETGYQAGELTYLVTLENGPQRADYFLGHYDGVQPIECNEGQAMRLFALDAALALPSPWWVGRVLRQAARVLGIEPRDTP